jgi:hypothetical protein
MCVYIPTHTMELKDEAVDRTIRRTRFGRGCGPVARQTEEIIYNIYVVSSCALVYTVYVT